MNKMQQEFDRHLESEGWELTVNNSKEGIKLWQKPTVDGFQIFKTIGVIRHPAEAIQRVICNNRAYRAKYDPQFDCAMFLERVAD